MKEDGFRSVARDALSSAKAELDTGDHDRLLYAALQLRMAMEALTYERAHAYRFLLPPEQCEAWQPRKVMKALLDMDPLADQGGTLFVGIEETYGVEAKQMSAIGTENVLSLAAIKKHYDALGSYLHLPTLKQLREGTAVDRSTIRERCNVIVAAIEPVLYSPVFSITMARDIRFDCFRCSQEIVRRTPLVAFEFTTACGEGGAEYKMQGDGSEQVTCAPGTTTAACFDEGCSGRHDIWLDEYKEGTHWECKECGTKYRLVLRVRRDDPE